MLTLLITSAFLFARPDDAISAHDLEVVIPQSVGLGVALQRNLDGRALVRLVGGPEQRPGDQTLLARFGEYTIPNVKFRRLLAIGDRAFGVLEDDRVAEIAVELTHQTNRTGARIDRLQTGGVGAGLALVTAGAINGSVTMASAGAVIGVVAGALPRVFPAAGRELWLQYHVEVLGGDHPYEFEAFVERDGRPVDLTLMRDQEELSLRDLLRDKKDCSYLLVHEFVMPNRRIL